MSIRTEAHLLSIRIGFRQQACERWLRHVGIQSILDLKDRYPGASHTECMRRAADEIAAFILTE